MKELPFSWKVAYAYGASRERGNSVGSRHIQLWEPYVKGRLVRKELDALCKTTKYFSYLAPINDDWPVDCPKCLAMSERL